MVQFGEAEAPSCMSTKATYIYVALSFPDHLRSGHKNPSSVQSASKMHIDLLQVITSNNSSLPTLSVGQHGSKQAAAVAGASSSCYTKDLPLYIGYVDKGA